MISAPSEIRCRVMPIASSTTKVIASTSGIASDTTKPARTPSETKLTASTISTASTRARMKWSTLSFTTCGWSATLCTSMPIGRPCSSSAMRASSAVPKSRMLPPSRMPMLSPMAGAPL